MLLGCCHCDRDNSSSDPPPSESIPSESQSSQSVSVGEECSACAGGVVASEYEIEWALEQRCDDPGRHPSDPTVLCFTEAAGPFYVQSNLTSWPEDERDCDVVLADAICCFKQIYDPDLGCVATTVDGSGVGGGKCGPSLKVSLAFYILGGFRFAEVTISWQWCNDPENGLEEAPICVGGSITYRKEYFEEDIPCMEEIELDAVSSTMPTLCDTASGPGCNHLPLGLGEFPLTVLVRPAA